MFGTLSGEHGRTQDGKRFIKNSDGITFNYIKYDIFSSLLLVLPTAFQGQEQTRPGGHSVWLGRRGAGNGTRGCVL